MWIIIIPHASNILCVYIVRAPINVKDSILIPYTIIQHAAYSIQHAANENVPKK